MVARMSDVLVPPFLFVQSLRKENTFGHSCISPKEETICYDTVFLLIFSLAI